MKYTEMTMNQITNIVNRGGDDLRELNKAVAEHLDSMNLSDKAQEIINTTDIDIFAETFGGLFTVEQLEEYINENY